MSKSSQYVRRNRRKKAAHIRSLKEKACMDCGSEFPPCAMHFDHVRGIKEFTIADAVRLNYSLKRIYKEIEKCELVCGNCHAIRHCPHKHE